MNDRNKGIAITLLAAVIWSTGGLFIKLLPQDAFTILFFRSAYAGLFFLLVFQRDGIRWDRQALRVSLFYAPLLICFVIATKLTTAANAIFLQYLAPAIVLVVEPRLLKTTIKRLDLVTVIICLAGLSLFLFEKSNSSGHWIGNLVGFISGFLLAGLILALRWSDRKQQASGIVLGNIWVVLITLPWLFNSTALSLTHHAMFIYLGVIQIGLGYVLFTYGQRRISAIDASLLALLEPILNPVWVWIGYGEMPSPWGLAGGVLIISAVMFRLVVLHGKQIRFPRPRA